MKNNLKLILIIILVILSCIFAYQFLSKDRKITSLTRPTIVEDNQVNDFESCVNAGNMVLESYPPQCRTKDGKSYTQDIGNEFEKTDLIVVNNPRPGAKITSQLTIKGEARGSWYFEGSFPVELQDSNGNVISTTIAQAQGEWMTDKFVPFEAIVEFPKPESEKGNLILKKDNPSGIPENDDFLRIPVVF
jgi:hypothetical protein